MDSSAEIGAANDEDTSSSSLLPEMPTELPLATAPKDCRSALEEFRDNWQNELKNMKAEDSAKEVAQPTNEASTTVTVEVSNSGNDQHAQAESLFRKAVELEQRGKVYDALPLYRKAVQIDPDIELKFYERQNVKAASNPPLPSSDMSAQSTVRTQLTGSEVEVEEEEESDVDLYEKFQVELALNGGKLVSSNRETGVISTELHISDLPAEIIHSILRWVVSSQLDMRSLEQCAAVCKGMYLCARDEKLWRLACEKVWGQNVGHLGCPDKFTATADDANLPVYNSWREMYINRERVHFGGCYISKTSYLRLGENSFQDQYYRPVQLVEYYRYMRFLPDGTVMMMTSAEEPVTGVTKLKLTQSRAGILRGHYRIYGDIINVMLFKNPKHSITGKMLRNSKSEEFCTKYCMQFKIASTTKRKFVQLAWMSYSMAQISNVTPFELTQSMFPPLWYSPVRSYHLNADAPLA